MNRMKWMGMDGDGWNGMDESISPLGTGPESYSHIMSCCVHVKGCARSKCKCKCKWKESETRNTHEEGKNRLVAIHPSSWVFPCIIQ
jgi:hypothetical protein